MARWAPRPTWPTSPPTSRTTSPPGCAACPHRLGAAVSAVTGAVLLFGASLVLVLGPDGPPTPAGWAGLVVAVPAAVVAALAGTARFRRLAFPAVMLLTVLDVVLLLLGGAALT